jgi:hypothetical protein
MVRTQYHEHFSALKTSAVQAGLNRTKSVKNVLHRRLGMKSDYTFYSFLFCLFDLGNRGFRNPTDRVEPRVIASLIITSIEKVEIAVGTFLHS